MAATEQLHFSAGTAVFPASETQAIAPVRTRIPYWLHPLFLALGALGLPAWVTYCLPGPVFLAEWNCAKYLAGDDLVLVGMALGAFAVGLALPALRRTAADTYGGATGLESGVIGQRRVIRAAFWLSAALTLLGTAVWAFFTVRQGVGLGEALAALRGQSAAVVSIREKAETIPGITTLTQFSMAAAVLAGILWFDRRKRLVRLTFTLIFLLALLRAILRAERLAVIEVAVPFAVSLLPGLLARHSHRRSFRVLLLLVPPAALAALAIFFGVAEYGRSYEAKANEGMQHSAVEYGMIRLGGYYGTSLNNGAYLMHHLPPSRFPYFSLEWLWRFPGVSLLVQPREITGIDGDKIRNLLTADMNFEFNNPSGIFAYEHDFGRWGLLVAAAAAGLLIAVLFRRYRQGASSGRLLYPLVVTGLLEISRIPYLTSGRVFPSMALLLLLAFASLLLRSREPAVYYPQ